MFPDYPFLLTMMRINWDWAIPEKIQTRRSCIWNFQGYQINNMWNFQRLIKNKVEFPSVIRNNNVAFPGLWFLASDFPRDLTQLCAISRGWALFCLELPGLKWKNSREFSKKYILNPPCLDFFCNIPLIEVNKKSYD